MYRLRTDEWKKAVAFVMKRDNNLCRRCKKKAHSVHHILPYIWCHSNNPNILIATCKRDHRLLETKFKKYGITHYEQRYIEENILYSKTHPF